MALRTWGFSLTGFVLLYTIFIVIEMYLWSGRSGGDQTA
jgi:hypothetical protein